MGMDSPTTGFLGHGETSARNCLLFEQAVHPISTGAKHVEKCWRDCFMEFTSDRVDNNPTGVTFRFQVRQDMSTFSTCARQPWPDLHFPETPHHMYLSWLHPFWCIY